MESRPALSALIVLLIALVALPASAAQQTVDFTSTNIPFPPPSSFTDSGFTFSVSGGYQRGFQTWYSYTSNAPGVMTSDVAPDQTLTITIRRTDNSTFTAVSLFVYNTDNNNATVQPRLAGANVGTTTTIAPDSGQTVSFGNLVVDQIRIVGQTNPTYSQMVLFDTLVYEVPNLPPVVANLSGDTATFTQGGAPVTLDQGTAATVTDSDSTDFAGGTVSAAIVSNEWTAEDELLVGAVGPITVSTGTVSHSGVAIGTAAGGTGGADLVVTLNASATPARVQDLVRALQYRNSNTTQPDLGPRGVRVRVSDGDGTTPPDQNLTVKVSPTAPPAGTRTVTFTGVSFGLPLPTSFTLDGFTFAVSGGFQRGFQETYESPVPPGIMVLDTSPGSNLTVTMARFDGADFDMHSLIVSNRDENTAMGVSGRNNGATVVSFSVPSGATRRLLFSGATVDQIVLTGQTSASLSQAGFFDELTFLIGNAPPEVLGLAGTTASFVQGGPPVTLDQGTPATVTDADSADFNGGAVRARITASAVPAEDALEVGDIGPISVSGATVSHSDAGGVVIGTTTGAATGDLTIALTADATPARVQDLVRALLYRDTSSTPDLSTRTVEVTVDDGDGALPTSQVLSVKVLPSALPAGVLDESYSGLVLGANVTTFDFGGYRHTVTGGIQRYFQTASDVPFGLGVRAGDTSPGQNLTVTITRVDSGDFILDSLIAGNRDDGATLTVTARNNGATVATRTLAAGRTRRLEFGGVTVDELRLTGQTGPVDGTALVFDDLAVIPPNVAPTISDLDGDSLSWVEDVSGLAPLDQGTAATVADPDATGWDGGDLTATFASGGTTADLLAIVPGNGVALSAGMTVGSTVSVDGVDIGTLSADGTGGGDLVLDLGAGATDARLSTLLQQLGYGSLSQNPQGSRTVEITVTDLAGGTSQAAAVTVTLTATNDAPGLIAPGSIAVTEDLASPITGLTVSDVDAAGGDLQLVLTVPRGSLAAVSGGGVTAGGTPLALTLSGTVTNLQSFLGAGSVTFLTASNDVDDVSLGLSLNDLGNSGAGGALTATASTLLTVSAVNDPPTLATTGALSVTEDQATALAALSLGDVDSGTESLQLTLTVPRGELAATPSGPVTVGGSATALTLTGALADLQATIAGGEITYTTADNDTADVALQLLLDDLGHTGAGGPQTASLPVTIAVDPVNDPPTVAATGALTVTEDQASALTALTLDDVDAGAQSMVLTLSVPRGELAAAPSGPVTVGGSATALTLTGALADLQATLAGGEVTYTTADNDTADVALQLLLDDQGASGSGGAQSASLSLTVSVDPVNDPPTLATTGPLSVTEDQATALTALSLGDVDSGTESLQLTLTVPRGELAATPSGPVTVGGSATALTLTGTLADLQAAIAGGEITYTTADNDTADVALQLLLDDLGHTGAGGPQTASLPVTITVDPVNDPPTVAATGALTVTEDQASALTALTLDDVDAGAQPMVLTLSVPRGELAAAPSGPVTVGGNAAALTLTGALADLQATLAGGEVTYTTAENDTADVVLQLLLDDQGASGSGGPQNTSLSLTVSVDPVNDPPTLDLPTSLTVTEDQATALDGISIGDVDAGGSPLQLSLTVDRGTLEAVSGVARATTAPLGTLVLTGTLDELAALLDGGGVTFTTELDDTGDVALTATVDDQGASGAGGALTATASSILTVAAVNDPPSLVVPGDQVTSTDTPLEISAAAGNEISMADVDALASAVELHLEVGRGELSAAPGSGATITGEGTASLTIHGSIDQVNAAVDGLTYLPSADYSGLDLLAVTADDLGSTGSGGPLTETASVTLVVDRPGPPRVATVEATSALGAELDPCETLRTSVRGLELDFSEDMADPPGSLDPDDATNPSNYQVVGAGPDLDLTTTLCGVVDGDDVPVPTLAVSYDAVAHRATVTLGRILDEGRFRVLACGTTTLEDLVGDPLDGDGDGNGGDDFSRDFRVDVGNLLTNGHLDCDLRQWTTTPSDPGSIEWSASDAGGSSQSGSVHATRLSAASTFGVAQCVELAGDGGGTLRSRHRIDVGPFVPVAFAQSCELYAGLGCSGGVLDSSGTSSLTLGPTSDWIDVDTAIVGAFGALSARCSFQLEITGSGAFEGWIDDMSYRENPVGVIFTDGFEDGTADAWSVVVSP